VSALSFAELCERVHARWPAVEAKRSDNGQPFLLVPATELVALVQWLRSDRELRFDALSDLTGYDLMKYPATPPSDAIAVVYVLFSYVQKHKLMLRVLAPRAACVVPSVSFLWPAALYFEREVWDLLGVHFDGHPTLLRIMTPQDWVGHPLRKDYIYPSEYHGVPHLREGQHFEHVPQREGDAVKAAPGAPAAPAKGAPPA
jgi:NADH-quinone oxidoreductase subunit C